MVNEVSGFLTSHTGGYINRIDTLNFQEYQEERSELEKIGFVIYDIAPNPSLLEIKMDVFEKNTSPFDYSNDTFFTAFILFNPVSKESELFVLAKRLGEIEDIEKELSTRLMDNIAKKKGEVGVLLGMS
ncbi:hypothetical protein M0P65_00470 [Candidatus Gracilibacteria bacterium]|nr:hypothetical protein [Candidatus Gracilibacteria bacterium]